MNETDILSIKVLDKDTLSSDLIGIVDITLDTYKDSIIKSWHTITEEDKKTKSGEIELEISIKYPPPKMDSKSDPVISEAVDEEDESFEPVKVAKSESVELSNTKSPMNISKEYRFANVTGTIILLM